MTCIRKRKNNIKNDTSLNKDTNTSSCTIKQIVQLYTYT